METIYQTWAETVALFERRGLPEELYGGLYEEEYILHPGPAAPPGSLWLDDHQYRHLNPWIRAGGRPEYEGIDGAVTGYVVDGDLEIDGNVLNLDFGSPALIVLGDLRVANLVLAGDARLLVRGGIEAETVIGTTTDGVLAAGGDLRAGLAVLWDEFLPEIGGRLRGRPVVPGYADLAGAGLSVDQPDPAREPAELLVPEILIPAGADPGDDDRLAGAGLRYEGMLDRLVAGLPLLRDGRAVAPLKELPPPR
ncbi:hypothetical protein AB0O01_16335 [Streptomyces sp. NPDC093252]|uniref:hypothetical protein n=1 Tax=Streptomyces sp. NPDC093252 TaxID=3154980 RepID=UPI00341BC186